jgi:hypothetical protein
MHSRLSPVVINVRSAGNLGNQMLQYMGALKLAEHIPNAVLSGVKMDDWGIDFPEIAQENPKVLRYFSDFTERLDFAGAAQHVRRGRYDRVQLELFFSHVANLPAVEDARRLFPLKADAEGYGTDRLVINVRGAEILRAVHREYTVIPASFYRDVISMSNLVPVFFGQVDGDGEYLANLKATFPGAEFVASRGAHHDFSVLAKSKNIVAAVSTFSWLAAWLSQADRIIMPLSGFCNPLQYPAVDLMPPGDSRFQYYLFPSNYAVPDSEILAAHDQIAGKWRPVTYEEVQAMRPPRRPPLSPDIGYRRARRRIGKILRRVGLR